MNTGQRSASNVLAALVSGLTTEHDAVSLDEITMTPAGLRAKVFLPSGDTFVVTVEWAGDRESAT